MLCVIALTVFAFSNIAVASSVPPCLLITNVADYSEEILQCAVNDPPVKCLIGTDENPAQTCDQIIADNPYVKSGVYVFKGEGESTYAGYCEFGSLGGCGGGPWNLVMRTDGSKDTFQYNSNHWTSKSEYNQASVDEGIGGNSEMKLESYWSAAVQSLCIGMRVDGVTNWLKLPVSGASLYDLLAGDKGHPTTLSRDAWKSLIDNSSLQQNCNRQGLNVNADWLKIRFGIIANQENDCGSPDSFIGIGSVASTTKTTTGNYAIGKWDSDNGDRNTKAIGLVLVKSTPS